MARCGPSHEVVARWEGGLKATVSVGDFSFVVDEPEAAGGPGQGPCRPTTSSARWPPATPWPSRGWPGKRDIEFRRTWR